MNLKREEEYVVERSLTTLVQPSCMSWLFRDEVECLAKVISVCFTCYRYTTLYMNGYILAKLPLSCLYSILSTKSRGYWDIKKV